MAGCRNAKKMGMPSPCLQDFILAGERRSDPIGRGMAEEVEMTNVHRAQAPSFRAG